MKFRKGFVSNSSSSSFVVIGTRDQVVPEIDGYELNVPEDFKGETEFGWGPDDYCDFGSRLNFAYLQTTYGPADSGWLQMLEDVLVHALYVDQISWNIEDQYDGDKRWGYIDHQSCASEGKNTQIFESKENLQQFLFAPDSYIHTDNDN